ncbi:hypothetical protein [Roseivivax sp.]
MLRFSISSCAVLMLATPTFSDEAKTVTPKRLNEILHARSEQRTYRLSGLDDERLGHIVEELPDTDPPKVLFRTCKSQNLEVLRSEVSFDGTECDSDGSVGPISLEAIVASAVLSTEVGTGLAMAEFSGAYARNGEIAGFSIKNSSGQTIYIPSSDALIAQLNESSFELLFDPADLQKAPQAVPSGWDLVKRSDSQLEVDVLDFTDQLSISPDG